MSLLQDHREKNTPRRLVKWGKTFLSLRQKLPRAPELNYGAWFGVCPPLGQVLSSSVLGTVEVSAEEPCCLISTFQMSLWHCKGVAGLGEPSPKAWRNRLLQPSLIFEGFLPTHPAHAF